MTPPIDVQDNPGFEDMITPFPTVTLEPVVPTLAGAEVLAGIGMLRWKPPALQLSTIANRTLSAVQKSKKTEQERAFNIFVPVRLDRIAIVLSTCVTCCKAVYQFLLAHARHPRYWVTFDV
jgi:hypothetical protein